MTLTTEQLRARAKIWRKKAVDAKWQSVSIAQDMLLNAEAFDELADNREARPVYQYRMRNPYNGQVTDWETIKPEKVDFILKETIAANVEFRIIAAPPAPANAKATGYFLRYRVEWHTPSKWSAWAEIDEATYDKAVKIIATGEADAGRFYEARILYDAPPAPAVPPEVSPADIPQEHNINTYSGITWAASWNACRAAMLAQSVSRGYKFVPVEPTEDMIAAAMNCDDVTFTNPETFCVNFGNIYAAMLAAAPEGRSND
ncbi:hypothetical protein [Serratia sp. B501]|uniref:hypothetical protein n=1 Tax=Serratia sp. B501 TaxID=3444318 RepID=UPI003EB922BC